MSGVWYYIVAAIIIAWAVICFIRWWRGRKEPCCGGGCASCARCGSCKEKNIRNKS